MRSVTVSRVHSPDGAVNRDRILGSGPNGGCHDQDPPYVQLSRRSTCPRRVGRRVRPDGDEITAEQREACMGDALRLCGSEIPDVDRVLVCMRAKKSQVSARCKATIPKTLAASL